MASLCLSSSRIVSLHHQKPLLSIKLRPRSSDLSSCLGHATSAVCFNPLRLSADRQRTATVSSRVEKRRKRGSSVVCYAGPMLSVQNLQWISTISCVALMLARGTGIHKSFVVPLFVLHAPSSIITWVKGEYGIWAAFLALLTRLFFTFPGELELPFIALLLVIVAPYQVMSIRGKQEGVIISLAISCFLAFQHFSRAGSLQKAVDQSSVLATVAIIGVTVCCRYYGACLSYSVCLPVFFAAARKQMVRVRSWIKIFLLITAAFLNSIHRENAPRNLQRMIETLKPLSV